MLTQRLSPLYSLAVVSLVLLVYFYFQLDFQFSSIGLKTQQPFTRPSVVEGDEKFPWHTRPESYPVTSMIPLPSGKPIKLPQIQHVFPQELPGMAKERIARRNEVKSAFVYAWKGYKEHAWMKDELAPISGISRSHFGGWAATLIDSLDTLWIMDLREEFEEAVKAVANIDFSSADQEEISTFETNIRYLGGLIAAYDLSGGKYPILLQKAVELGDMLYAAFDTPNRMPIARWRWKIAKEGHKQESSFGMVLAELGSFSLEFTRLSQLSGDPKFFDAIERITQLFSKQQGSTKLPGLFPIAVNTKDEDFSSDGRFSLGAMTDSFYEYLPKEYILMGGLSEQYRTMYEYAIDAAKKHLLFRPMTKEKVDLLISGNMQVNSTGESQIDPQGQHLGCFVGGMVGIGSKIFNRPKELAVARKLVDGCIWAYQSMPTGIMPEIFQVVPCENTTICEWDEGKWHAGIAQWHEDFSVTASPAAKEVLILDKNLVPGFTEIIDRRYLLRPEAIESIFILFRITGDEKLREDAWKMFELIDTYTRAEFGHASLRDVTIVPPPKLDSMESFWTAETLKYFYLIFSEPDLVNLDEWVFNTEAHPFKRPHYK